MASRADIEGYARERRFKPATLARWLALAADDADPLFQLAAQLRLGENQLLDLWNWSEEIAVRDHLELKKVLGHGAVRAALERDLGRNDKLNAVRSALRRLRYPELSRAEDELEELIKALRLPSAISLTLPPFLEGETVHVSITAGSVQQLRSAVAALHDACATAQCAEIFDRLRSA